MKRILLVMLILVSISGCSIVEGLLGNIGGYDLSACADDLGLCTELYLDNMDLIPLPTETEEP